MAFSINPNSGSRPGSGGRPPPLPVAVAGGTVVAVLIAAVLVLLPMWVWFFWRIEPGNGQIAVLIRKTGADLDAADVLATRPEEKGIQLEVLPEGRYFRNPYVWGWRMAPIVDIPAGKLGVRVRLFGEDLAPGRIIADEGQKGIVADVLRPGKYRVNPYAYDVQVFDAIQIRPGCAGVVTSLVGDDILTSAIPETFANGFLVGESMKGVLSSVLAPGTYYLNPYMLSVVEVNLQSQRFEMSGDDAITFLTADGFTVRVEGTIEFNLRRESAALLTHRVGDLEDIMQKIILPRARGFSRIEGSKKPAVDFIVGETRQQFQDHLETHLQETCTPYGVSVNSVLIRNIIPPDEVARIIRDREIAVQEARKFEQQIQQARSRAELVRQETLALQNKVKVEAETVRIRAVIVAEQEQSVKVTGGEREVEVATIDQRAAGALAQAVVLQAEAERDVIRMGNEAEASVLANRVQAFGSGREVARFSFYTAVAPRIERILTTDRPDGMGNIFAPFLETGKETGR